MLSCLIIKQHLFGHCLTVCDWLWVICGALHFLLKTNMESHCIMFLFLPPPLPPLFQIYHSPITKQEESESLLLLFLGAAQALCRSGSVFPCRCSSSVPVAQAVCSLCGSSVTAFLPITVSDTNGLITMSCKQQNYPLQCAVFV